MRETATRQSVTSSPRPADKTKAPGGPLANETASRRPYGRRHVRRGPAAPDSPTAANVLSPTKPCGLCRGPKGRQTLEKLPCTSPAKPDPLRWAPVWWRRGDEKKTKAPGSVSAPGGLLLSILLPGKGGLTVGEGFCRRGRGFRHGPGVKRVSWGWRRDGITGTGRDGGTDCHSQSADWLRNDRGESAAAAANPPACHSEEPVGTLVTWESASSSLASVPPSCLPLE